MGVTSRGYRGGVRVVATDLDGTLLRSDLSVSRRTVAAIRAVQAAGITIVPVTARQPLGLAPIAEAAGLTGWALCGNGALGSTSRPERSSSRP